MASTTFPCDGEKPRFSESPPVPGSPVRYVLCSCANCGWTDGFREDCISGQRVDGYCDNCDAEREFRVIEENKVI